MVWLTNVFVGNKRAVLYNTIGRYKHLILSTEVLEKEKITNSLIQDNFNKFPATVRDVGER